MNWKDIANTVGKAAPLVGSLLGGSAGGAVGTLVSKALGTDNTPDAVARKLNDDPDAMLKLEQLEKQHEQKLTEMHLEAEATRLTEINKTMRAEAASNDAYVRRWRPTFGYVAALTWFLQCASIAWSIVAEPSQAGTIATLTSSLTPMWGVALAVLGISISSRSKDKQVQAGQRPDSGILGALARRLGGKGD